MARGCLRLGSVVACARKDVLLTLECMSFDLTVKFHANRHGTFHCTDHVCARRSYKCETGFENQLPRVMCFMRDHVTVISSQPLADSKLYLLCHQAFSKTVKMNSTGKRSLFLSCKPSRLPFKQVHVRRK